MYEWLQNYIKLKDEIAYLEFNLEQTKCELKRWMLGGDLSGIQLQPDSLGAKVEDNIEKITLELIEKCKQRDELIALVEKFDGLDNQILRMKWFEGKTLEQISIELNYSYGYIKRKHAEIVKCIKFVDTFK